MSFWVKDPTILFNQKYIKQIWPYSYLTYEEKLNAMTRFVIIISILGYMLLNRMIIIILGMIIIGCIVLLYKKKDGFFSPAPFTKQEIEQTNPFGNVMMNDYKYNPNKSAVNGEYSPETEKSVNKAIKDFIVQENNDNNEINNLFNNVGDQFTFEQNNRQFFTNPSTTIPNKQDDFFKVPIEKNIFMEVPYYSKTSTTDIIKKIINMK
jgi:hypothetical protein